MKQKYMTPMVEVVEMLAENELLQALSGMDLGGGLEGYEFENFDW